jgi:integrase
MAKARKLTAPGIKAMKPSAVREEYPDAGAPGLHLVVQPTGTKSWAYRYRHHGQKFKITLGTVDEIGAAIETPAIGGHLSLGDARRLAGDLRHHLALGRNPAEVITKPVSASLSDAIEDFIRRHAKGKGLRTADAVARSLRTDLVAKLPGVNLVDISRADLIRVIDAKAVKAPVQANRLRAHISKFFAWCVSRDLIQLSPAAGIEVPTKEVSRVRVLTDAEIAALWAATAKTGYPFGPLVRVLLLTGQRLGEVAEMEAHELTSTTHLWTIPRERAKNGVEHVVPMSPEVEVILSSLPRIGDRFLFTTTGKTPVSGFNKAKRALDREMLSILQPDVAVEDRAMPHWQFHDLRRTAATLMARAKVAPHIIESVLNHRTGKVSGIAAVYNRFDYLDEKRAALETLAGEVKGVVGGAA